MANLPTGTGAALIRDLILEQFEAESAGLQMAQIGVRAKLKMQAQIVAFMAQRRFDHAILATAFYRNLFRGSAQELGVGSSAIQSVLPDFELPPTVDQLEFFAREAINDIAGTVAAAENAFDGNRRVAALERIQEAFFLGGHPLPVIAFPQSKRAVLRELYYDLSNARQLAELRDLDALESVVDEIAAVADDFPASEARSRIRLARSASTLKVNAARAALLAGDAASAQTLLNEAAAIWPLNPELTNFIDSAVANSGVVNDFDIDYRNGDYRRIYNRRREYLGVLAADEIRSQQLELALTRIQRLDFSIAAAGEQSRAGNPYAAWEILSSVNAIGENDPSYMRALTSVIDQIPEFISALNRGRRLREDGQWAASLSHFLRARELYPLSTVAETEIRSLAGAMLDQAQILEGKDAPEGPDATPDPFFTGEGPPPL